MKIQGIDSSTQARKAVELFLETRKPITFEKNRYLFLPDEKADKIFFVKEGKVKIASYGSSGKEITKNIIGDGEFFGESSIFGSGNRRRNFALTESKTLVYTVTNDDLKFLIRRKPELLFYFLKIIGQRKLELERRLESLYFKDSRARVIEFLYNFGTNKGERVGFETVVRRRMTHQDIANLTATSRQTVTTVLNELRNRNIITFNRRRFLIRSMETLGREGLVAV